MDVELILGRIQLITELGGKNTGWPRAGGWDGCRCNLGGTDNVFPISPEIPREFRGVLKIYRMDLPNPLRNNLKIES